MKLLFKIYLAVVFMRFFIALEQHPMFDLSSDDYYYYLNSKGFFYFGDLLHYNDGTEGVFNGPNYLYQILVSFSFLFHNPLIVVKLFNSFLLNSIVFPVYLVLKNYNRRNDAILYASSILFYPQFNFVGFWITEVLAIPLFVWYLYFLYVTRKLNHRIIISIVFSILIFYTRPQFLPIVFSFIVVQTIQILFQRKSFLARSNSFLFLLVLFSIVSVAFWVTKFLYNQLGLIGLSKYLGYYYGYLALFNFEFYARDPEIFLQWRTWFLDWMSTLLTQVFIPLFLIFYFGINEFRKKKIRGIDLLWRVILVNFCIIVFMHLVLYYGRDPLSRYGETHFVYYTRYFLPASISIYFMGFATVYDKRKTSLVFKILYFGFFAFLAYRSFFIMNPLFPERNYHLACFVGIEISIFKRYIENSPYQNLTLILFVVFSFFHIFNTKENLVYVKRAAAWFMIFFWILTAGVYMKHYKTLCALDPTYFGFPDGMGYQEGQRPQKWEWLNNKP